MKDLSNGTTFNWGIESVALSPDLTAVLKAQKEKSLSLIHFFHFLHLDFHS